MVRARAWSRPIFRCSRSTSTICAPIVWTGESELIGSWKIMPIRQPRMARIASPRGGSFAMSVPPSPPSRMLPATMRPGASTSCIRARAVTLLPDPLSPTRQSVRPLRRLKPTSRTAVKMPARTANSTVRFLTSSTGAPALILAQLP